MGGSINGGSPKWLVCKETNPIQMDDLGVPMGTPISGNHQMGFDKPSMIPVFNAAKNEEQ